MVLAQQLGHCLAIYYTGPINSGYCEDWWMECDFSKSCTRLLRLLGRLADDAVPEKVSRKIPFTFSNFANAE